MVLASHVIWYCGGKCPRKDEKIIAADTGSCWIFLEIVVVIKAEYVREYVRDPMHIFSSSNFFHIYRCIQTNGAAIPQSSMT
jgi:hypothetical protein